VETHDDTVETHEDTVDTHEGTVDINRREEMHNARRTFACTAAFVGMAT
jgi:hypothetical protein